MGTLSEEQEHRVVPGILLRILHVCLSPLHNLVLMSEPRGDDETELAYVEATSHFHLNMNHVHVSSCTLCFNISQARQCKLSLYSLPNL